MLLECLYNYSSEDCRLPATQLKTLSKRSCNICKKFVAVCGVALVSSPAIGLQLSASQESYLAARATPKSSTSINADNRTFQLSSQDLSLDLRPDLKATFNENHKIVLRPRWLGKAENTNLNGPDETKNKSQGTLQLTDFYVENIWSDHLRTVSGLQVYQWGGAELLNPSNPLFHFNNNQKSAFYKEKGKLLIRTNVDYSRNWSQVFIIEPISNNESPWIASQNNDGSMETFSAKGLIRTEWNSSQGLNSASFTIGKEERQKNFIGETITYSPFDGISLYADAKQSEGSLAFEPTANVFGSDSLTAPSQNNIKQLAIIGARLEDSHFDLRFELIDNQSGWDKSQFARVVRLLKTQSPDIFLNYARFAKPGLELFSQRYYYLSLRFPNVLKKQDLNFAMRYLLSDLDGSSSLQTSLDWSATESLTGFVEAITPFGSTETDLNFTGQSSYLLGLKWNI